MRFCNRLTTKSERYQNSYSTFKHVANKPFVVAFALFDPASQLAHNRPIVVALYGVYFDEEQTITAISERVTRYPVSTVTKSPLTDLSIGCFCDAQYQHVSAVLYSRIAGMGKLRALANNPNDQAIFVTLHPNPDSIEPHVRQAEKTDYTEHLLDGLYVMHNPYASCPLDLDALAHERIAQITVDDDGDAVTLAPDDSLQFRTVWTLRTRQALFGKNRLDRAPFPIHVTCWL